MIERLERLRLIAGPYRGFLVCLLECREHLFTVDVDRPRRFDPETNLVAAHFKNGHDNVVTDHDALVRSPGKHEHGVLPPWWPPWPRAAYDAPTHPRADPVVGLCRCARYARTRVLQRVVREGRANVEEARVEHRLARLVREAVHHNRAEQVHRRVFGPVAERDDAQHDRVGRFGQRETF